MALNIKTLQTRSITALVFVVVMLSGLLINQWSFLLLFSIIHLGCWYEYFKIVGLIHPPYQHISNFHKTMIVLGGFGFMLFCTPPSMQIDKIPLKTIGYGLIVLFATAFPFIEIVFNKQKNIKLVFYSLLGLIYISLSWSLLMNMRGFFSFSSFKYLKSLDISLVYILILISSIWINDTMAYIVGSIIGKTPLSSISPKKTWEGTLGGIILCVLFVGYVVAPWFFGESFTENLLGTFRLIAMCIALIAAVVGTLGDLLESKLKRLANIKDSGSFMPGHGGFLDRFDSLILATPFVWLFLKIVLKA
ncbi:MAG: phosphatidate cytidylyltransferase [Chitinophagaceae bacterium]